MEEGREGGKEGRKERERACERDPPVGKLFTENINSTKSIKRAFFPLKMKKIQLHSKMEGLNEHFKSYLSQAIS